MKARQTYPVSDLRKGMSPDDRVFFGYPCLLICPLLLTAYDSFPPYCLAAHDSVDLIHYLLQLPVCPEITITGRQ